MPEVVAGCPPDAFSETGQLWGNPVYDWDEQKATGYDWWIKRLERNCEFFDVLRFDHFHGFDGYYEIPYGDKTALNGVKRLGPGMDFFNTVKAKLGDLDCIAEDLGISTKRNRKLLKDAGFPGMKVLQFAFDITESSFYLPYCHIQNCVVYTGTHDNTTILDWISNASDHDRDYVRRYIHSENTDYGAFVWDFIREAFRSVADTCIVPLQDFLVKGKEARINTPGEAGNNWQWRLRPNFLSSDLARSIYGLTKVYGRIPTKKKDEEEDEEQPEE
jgi:4-alpha-glucanotransferase